MTPHEKQDLFSKIKLIKKRNTHIDTKNPEKVTQRAVDGDIQPCEVNKIKYLLAKEKKKGTIA